MNFKRFVGEQVERLCAFEAFARLPEGGKKEFVNALFDKAGEQKPQRDRSAFDWRDSIPANQVVSVINECLDFVNSPSLADVRAVWNRLFPPVAELRKDCDRCEGTGWVIVEGPFGTSAAHPCTHQPETEQDRRMGVRINPAQKQAKTETGVWK